MSDNKARARAPEQKAGRFRQYEGPLALLVKIVGAGGALFFLLYNAGIFSYARIFLLPMATNAIFVAVVLTMTFLLVPATKGSPRNKVPWYDVVLILSALAGTMYIFVNARDLVYFGKISATPLEQFLALLMYLTLAEAVRRSFGWGIVIIVTIFVLYAKLGSLFQGPLSVYPLTWSNLVTDVYLGAHGLFGMLTGIARGIIFSFITFGAFFVAAGGGDFFLKAALAVTGRMRGGPAKAAIIGSALFGTVSGSGAANVVVTGTTTIPLMKSIGYKPHYAAAIETIASTGGAIVPPIMAGVAFLVAWNVGKPYSYIATISILPAVLYFVALYTQVHLEAIKTGLAGLPREQLPSLKATVKGGWEFVIPFLVLIAILFFLKWQPEVAALYATLTVIFISIFRRKRRPNFGKLVGSLQGGMVNTMEIANIITFSGSLLALVSVTGLGAKVSAGLVTFAGGNTLILLILSAVACYVIGMGIAFTAAYILVAALVAPALASLGLPLVVAHYFIMYMVISGLFTPPVAAAAFIAGSIAGANPFRTAFQAMRLGIVVFLIPLAIAYNPALILIGSPTEIVLAAVTALIGVVVLSCGLAGYLFSEANWLQRVLFIAGGLAMFASDLTTDLIGLGILAIAFSWQWSGRKKHESHSMLSSRPK